jgi:N6-adenosine-specific RNA methylase IME4
LATKGHPQRVNSAVSQIIASPLRRHSQKPEEARDKIVSLLGGGITKIELFARERVLGWDAWGNEVESDISLINKTGGGGT